MIPTHSTSSLLQNSEFRIHNSPRAFSLLEVLIATLILGIGLIMVASIFPVGATWSRQGAEETIAQNLALNAVSIIKVKYASSGFTTAGADPNDAYYNAGTWTAGGAAIPAGGRRIFTLPNFSTKVPVTERAYAVGTGQPFPVPVARCSDAQYFWTSLIKVPNDNSTTVTLYILVFRRGDNGQNFTDVGKTAFPIPPASPVDTRSAATELKDCRGTETYSPSVWVSAYSTGKNGATITGAWPLIGSQGIGANSGTVFRQVLNPTFNTSEPSTPTPLLIGQTSTDVAPTENIISALPPDNWPDSPLIYIYQTQLSF